MNKQHWDDIYLNDVPTELVQTLIREAYRKGRVYSINCLSENFPP